MGLYKLQEQFAVVPRSPSPSSKNPAGRMLRSGFWWLAVLVLVSKSARPLQSFLGMSSTVTESTLMAMAELLEVSESGSTSEEEDFADGFVLVDDEMEKPKKLSAGRGMQPFPSKNNELITLVSFKKAPRTGSGSLSNSGTTVSPSQSQIMQHYSSSPSQQTNMSASGYSPSKSKVYGIEVIEDYQSGDSAGSLTSKQSHRFSDAAEDSKSGGTPRNKSGLRMDSSGGTSRSGSEIFSGSRSRVGESPQSLSNSGVHVQNTSQSSKSNLFDSLRDSLFRERLMSLIC